MLGVLQPARALVDPAGGVPPAVEARRWLFPLLLLAVSVALAGVAFALRHDPGPRVVRELAQRGELARLTEQEVASQIQTAGRVLLVAGVAKGVFAVPAGVLALALALALAGWICGVKAPFGAYLSAAALALLPLALSHLLFAAAAFRQPGLTEAQLITLVPASLAAHLPRVEPRLARVLPAVDFFRLWSVLLLGFGFSAATGMRRGRALLLCLLLYAMYVAVVMVWMPSLSPPGGGPGGPRGGGP